MIQSIARSLEALEILAENPEQPKFLSEIAGRMGLKFGTCANILRTLTDLHYVDQPAARKGYTLGMMAYFITRNGPFRKDLIGAAEAGMRKLAEQVRETVLLAVLSNGRRIILSKISGDDIYQVREQFLMREDIYRTATGRLLVAHAPKHELHSVLTRKGLPDKDQWPEADSQKKLVIALEKIRKDGKVMTSDSVAGISFPLYEKGKVVAALGLFLPKYKLTRTHKAKILSCMASAAKAISARLSGA
jgi:DNA-binding IclR family transcriptional regulator